MEYNITTTKIFFENEDKSIAICSPTESLSVETVAIRDLPAGASYWIVDFETPEKMKKALPSDDFFYAYELNKDVLGEPHGIALGIEEWEKQQSSETFNL